MQKKQRQTGQMSGIRGGGGSSEAGLRMYAHEITAICDNHLATSNAVLLITVMSVEVEFINIGAFDQYCFAA